MVRRAANTFVLLAVLFSIIQFVPVSPGYSAEKPAPKLVLISIDGLYPDIYLRPRELEIKMPNLNYLVSDGVSASGMRGIFPTTTYPSHAAIITGVRSYLNGITGNSTLGDSPAKGYWYWFSDSILVPTLPEVIHKKGLKVAVSCWPSLCEAPYVDFSLPEIWTVEKGITSRELVLRHATPGLVEKVEAMYGAWTDKRFDWGYQDDRIADGACALIKLEKPDLLLVHLVEVDHVLHSFGRDSREALDAFEKADAQVGRIFDALKKADMWENTNIIIVGDHGFANINYELRPNLELDRLGLLAGSDSAASPPTRAFFRSNAAAGAIYFSAGSDTLVIASTLKHFQKMSENDFKGTFDVLDRQGLQKYGAFPGAEIGLACEPGYTFSSGKQGYFITATKAGGTHGLLPNNRLMFSGFIASGPSFKKDLRIPAISILDVAPTAAAIFGTSLGPQVEGRVRDDILR